MFVHIPDERDRLEMRRIVARKRFGTQAAGKHSNIIGSVRNRGEAQLKTPGRPVHGKEIPMSESFYFECRLDLPLSDAIEKLTAALKNEGFGVLTRIDVHDVLKKKIDADFKPYVILGVCNPHLAHRALVRNSDVGMMLPCPITVEADSDSSSIIHIGNPDAFINFGEFADDPELQKVANEAREKLDRAAKSLQSAMVS